jgi:hypothetical protein
VQLAGWLGGLDPILLEAQSRQLEHGGIADLFDRRRVPRLIEVFRTDRDDCGVSLHSFPRGIGHTSIEHEQR